MYGECTHTPRPQVVSVSAEWWLRTSELPSGLTTSGESKSPTTMAIPPDAFQWGAWPRDAAVTRTGKQAGKALRSQGHHYARIMRQSVSGSLPL